MNESDFKAIVHSSPLKLVEHGYQILAEPSYFSSDYSPEFEKAISLGVICIIRFQPIPVPDIDSFQVFLIRRRLEIHADEDSPYRPLILDLRNLMLGLYGMDIFPPKQYHWEFTDEESLIERLKHAERYIVEYGIKWLEDPRSNIDWVRNRRKPNPFP